MRKITLVLLSALIFANCDPECSVEASCIAPPEGTFKQGITNLAILPAIIEESESGSFENFSYLDSAIVYAGDQKITIGQFYTWIAIGENSSVDSIDFHYDEELVAIRQDNFEFTNTESSFTNGGYLLGVMKKLETFNLSIDRASQDLIDGICNDTPVIC